MVSAPISRRNVGFTAISGFIMGSDLHHSYCGDFSAFRTFHHFVSQSDAEDVHILVHTVLHVIGFPAVGAPVNVGWHVSSAVLANIRA
jgi:hypothetical protein